VSDGRLSGQTSSMNRKSQRMRTFFVSLGLVISALFGALDVQAQTGPGPNDAAPNTVPADDFSPRAGRMTEDAAHAKRLFDAERWGEAAVQLKRVVDGTSNDDEGNRQIAQYHLAVALYRLQIYQGSYAIFSEIADKPNHLKFNETLRWLSKLASQLPESADVTERIGKYKPEQIALFNNPQQRKLYWKLNYLLGRYKYRNRDYAQALELFSKVDKSSNHYVHAQFFTGIGQVQSRKSAPALEAFRNVLETLDAGEVGIEDAARMRDLAHLSMARTYYSASIRFDQKGVPTVDGHNISAAIKSWDSVNEASEYWLDAHFEESWAYFLAGDFTRLLGNIHTIESPYFPKAFYPEAYVLEALVSYTVCHYDDAVTTVARMKNKYAPIKTELESMLGRFKGNDPEQKYFHFLRDVRSGKANLSPVVKTVVENTLSDRQLLLHLDYIQVLDEEEARFNKASAPFRNSPLGGDILDSIRFARDLAIRTAGSLARERYQRYLDELTAHLRNANNIIVEVTAAQRRKLEEPVNIGYVMQREPYLYGVVKPDDEHILWPFDGEYWRDELGFYRQVVKSRCRP